MNTRKQFPATQAIRRNERETLAAELAALHRLPRDERFALGFQMAWDQGHSAGLYEVKNLFSNLVPLIKTGPITP